MRQAAASSAQYPCRSFFRGPAHHGLLDLVADSVSDREMNLLDDRCVVAGHDQKMIAEGTDRFALATGEADGGKPELPRRAKRRQDVRRPARRGQRPQNVAALAEAFDLPREHLIE